MTEEQIAKLRAAGFSDTDINEYAANESKQTAGKQPVDPNAAPTSDLPEIDVTQKSDILKNAEAAGVSTTNPGSYLADAAALGAAAAPYVVPAALTAGGIYGASVAKQGFNAMKAAADARTAQANAQMAQTQGLQQRFDAREAARAAKAAPVSAAGPQIVNASGQPIRPTVAGPVAPAVAPAGRLTGPGVKTARNPAQPQVTAEVLGRERRRN